MRKIIGIIILCFMATKLTAQVSTDTELWPGTTFKLKLNKKFRIDVEKQFRFNDTISTLKSAFTEIGLRYRLDNHFAFKVNYRYIVKPINENSNRFSLDAYYYWDKKEFPLSLQYRLRFQDTKENNTGQKSTYIRNKLTVYYNLTKLVDPFLSYEIYYKFNQKNEFRTWRLTAGLDWRLSKKLDLTTFYRYQKEINVKNTNAQHVIGVMLTYKMGIKKKE